MFIKSAKPNFEGCFSKSLYSGFPDNCHPSQPVKTKKSNAKSCIGLL